MKLFFALIIFFLFNSCSFDNKSGVWKNENISSSNSEEKIIFKDFKKISTFEENFQDNISLNRNFAIKSSKSIINPDWEDIFFDKNNNFKNFLYNNNNQIIFKSRKLSKSKVNEFKLYYDGHLIVNNNKGDIIIYSIQNNKILTKFNFYKKKFKKINKELNLLVNKNIIYVSDNLGYLYAFDFRNDKIIWAKNYKIPFQSNLKIIDDKLIASNQNNNLYFFKKNNGVFLKQIPTEETLIKNQFKNNLSISNDDKLFFINSYGTLYSIDTITMSMNWFIYLKNSSDLTSSNLFFGNVIVNNDKNIIVSSNNKTFVIDPKNGVIKKKFNFSSFLKPVIYKNHVIILTKNNFLVAINLSTNEIIYSYDISEQILKLIQKENKQNIFKQIILLNNEIFIFLKNSEYINYTINGEFIKTGKLPSKIHSLPILIEGSILFINQKNKLIILD